MRVSEYFDLGLQQPELDFVDIDVAGDVLLFVDPRALRLLDTGWGAECRHLLQNFFNAVIEGIRSGQDDHARYLLSILREPNETHLGFSYGLARGRGMGWGLARKVWEALSESEAVATGLLHHLEDTVLLVEHIGPDIISDITTNVIRRPLIDYTQAVCGLYGIPMQEVSSGPLWRPERQEWDPEHVFQPVAEGHRLLLVPKAIVRRRLDYDPDQYYRMYMLPRLQQIEISENTELVRILKSGEPRVYKKDLEAKYGRGKAVSTALSLKYPDVLDAYRRRKERAPQPQMLHVEIAEATGGDMPDWSDLLESVTDLAPGHADSDKYERAIMNLLSALFTPSLMWPEHQTRIHDGRKRIDITFHNSAAYGFFRWVADNYRAPYILAECKNYTGDPSNPELDQLLARFSPRRGQVGFLICRRIADKDLFIKRCRDAAMDDQGYVVPLDDDDLSTLVKEARAADMEGAQHRLLGERFRRLVM